MYTREGNQVLRAGEVVATVNEDKTEFTEFGAKFKLPINKFLKNERKNREPVEEAIPIWKKPFKEAYPDAPVGNNALGSKDPDFCRWLKANHPEDFEKRYAGRRTCFDDDKPVGEKPTAKCVRAQKTGFDDCRARKGFRPDAYDFAGIYKEEYIRGYKNAGGQV